MAHFAYEGRTADGRSVSGIIPADSMEAAGRKLSQANQFIIKLAPADVDADADRPQRRPVSRLRAGRPAVMWFMNQLAVMVETGINLGEALDCLARQTPQPAMREVLQGVCEAVNEGRPLSDAMEQYPRTFPPAITAMVRAAEASGTLCLILARSADYLAKDLQTVRRFQGALIYPGLMFVMCVSVTVFLLTVILPRFEGVYGQRGALLPAPTRMLLALSRMLIEHGLVLLAGLVPLATAAVWGMRRPGGRALFDRVQLRLPVLGSVINKLLQSRAFRAFGTLAESGVPVDEILRLIRNTTGNTCYRALWAKAEEDVQNGQRLSVPLAASALIPPSVVQMIDCAERTGRIGKVFARLAEFAEKEYDQAITTTSQMLEPVMILVMGSVIGFVAIALLLPIFKSATVMAH